MVERSTTPVRMTRVLDAVGISRSSWYHRPVSADQRRRRGPPPKAVPEGIEAAVRAMAERYPFWGYKRIAIVCRRAGIPASDKQVYRVYQKHDLFLKQKRPRKAAIYQAAKLYELLPKAPNELWQMDVTYIHIPGRGWWYAVTVIDYFSRYLLACHLTPSYRASECVKALDLARAEAEHLTGPLTKKPFLVTDNGTSFIAHAFRDHTVDTFAHVRIQYRTPQQLGLLERFHQSLKDEEVYWRLYQSPGDCRACLTAYRALYNTVRPHWALKPVEGGDAVTPEDVYVHGRAVQLPQWQHWARNAKAKIDKAITGAEVAA